jgi:hypothetical protein
MPGAGLPGCQTVAFRWNRSRIYPS